MSNALAIAAVTAVLKNLLDNAMIDSAVSTNVGDSVKVSAVPPDRVKNGDNDGVRLNLFLYHVAPNASLRNAGLPFRNQNGERVNNAPLALDLHYLLTAYGQQDLEAEILLGYAMQVLHETSILPREAIRAALKSESTLDSSVLPPAFEALMASDLADQVELIKLTPQGMGSDEIYNLWGAFQTHYRPSVAYQASVVLIESKSPVRSPLPVLTRGQPDPTTGRDAGVNVQVNLRPPYPALHSVVPPNNQTAVRMGELLTCSGHQLIGDDVQVIFTHVPTSKTLKLSVSSGPTETRFQVQIPPDPPAAPVTGESPLNPDNWQVGVYRVSAVIERATQQDRVTNELPIALAPTVSLSSQVVGGEITLTATVSPKVGKTQQARLVIGDRELVAEPIETEKSETLIFKAKTDELPSGAQWFRLRVDGIESILVDRSESLPKFEAAQRVTI